MRELELNVLRFSGLLIGVHSFSYELDDAFFACFPEGEIKKASIKVLLEMEKSERMMVLHFHFKGAFKTHCDRCLNEIECEIDKREDVVVQVVERVEGKEDEIDLWWIDGKKDEIKLGQYFYETVVLERPIQFFCPNDENGNSMCDPKVLDRMNILSTKQEEEVGNWSASALEVLKKLKKDK